MQAKLLAFFERYRGIGYRFGEEADAGRYSDVDECLEAAEGHNMS